MLNAKAVAKHSGTPQYCLIKKAMPSYDLIWREPMDSSQIPEVFSQYFIRAEQGQGAVCGIRARNGSVMFYEIVDNLHAGISDEQIQEALRDPANACPLPGYYYLPREMAEKLRETLGKRDTSVPDRVPEDLRDASLEGDPAGMDP